MHPTKVFDKQSLLLSGLSALRSDVSNHVRISTTYLLCKYPDICVSWILLIKDIRPNVKFLLDQLLAESEAHLCKFSTCVAAVPVPALTDTCSAHTVTALTRHHGLGNDWGFFSEVSYYLVCGWFAEKSCSVFFFWDSTLSCELLQKEILVHPSSARVPIHLQHTQTA